MRVGRSRGASCGGAGAMHSTTVDLDERVFGDLRCFVLQAPGLRRNDFHERAAFLTARSKTVRDLRRALDLLSAAWGIGVTGAELMAAARAVNDGRLELSAAGYRYTCGQYFPSEYRAAVVNVLWYALKHHPAGGGNDG